MKARKSKEPSVDSSVGSVVVVAVAVAVVVVVAVVVFALLLSVAAASFLLLGSFEAFLVGEGGAEGGWEEGGAEGTIELFP